MLDQFNTAVKASLHQTKFATEVILSKNLEKRKDGNAYSLKLISSVNEKPLFSRNLLEDISSNAFTEAQKWKMMINAGMQIDGYSLDGAVRYFQMQEKLRNPICVDKNFVKFFPQVSGVPFVTYEAAAQNTSAMKYSAWVEKENISSEAYLGNEELTVQTAPQGSSLVGLWHMDQKSWNGTQGEIKDSSGQHNDGVAVNGVTTHDGKFLNEAAGPFRSGQYLSLETKNFPTRSAPRTMMIWFKMNPNSFNTNQVMFSVGGNYGYGNRADLFYHADLRKKYLCVEGMNIFLGFSWKPDSNWHQFVAVYPPEQSLFGKFQLYLDGVLQSTEDNTYGYALQSGAEPATIGGGWSDNAFQGDLDEAAIWSTALTPAEIKSMYQRQRVH